LASVILGGLPNSLTGSRVVTLPVLAALVMVAWDLCMDPIWATVVRAWIWQQGGAYFCVPLSNFFGWYLTVYIIYQLFALYLRRRVINLAPLPSSYLQLTILFYGVSAAGNLLLLVLRPGLSQVTDATGKVWQVSSIVASCVFATIFTMGAFTVLAWIRLRNRSRTARASDTRGLTARHLATR
jgi:putative membrane protein